MSTSTYQFFYKHAVNRIVSTFLAVLVAALGTTAGTARADQSVVTTLGGAVSLYGGADGTEPFTYQWRKDGVAISGATSSSFLITSAQVASAGIYTVLISNALGSTLSDIATVSIGASAGTTTTSSTTPAPTPTNPAPVSSTAVAPTVSDPASVTVVAGNSATFSVTAGGSPTPAVHWELSTNGGITYNFLNDDAVFSGTQTSTLTIQKSDSSQNGWLFLCKAINSANSVTSGSATLTVTAIAAPTTTTTPGSTGTSTATNSPPTVTDPSDAATTAGASATFSVTAAGSPAPAIKWQVSTDGGQTYTYLADDGSYSGSQTATLTVLNTTTAQNGWRFLCKAVNSVNSATSDYALLAVAPVISGSTRRDFNNDGNTDILFRNSNTGEVAIWLMQGIKLDQSVSVRTAALVWDIVGTGDFNNDGKTDILWRNKSTGEIAIWLMNGTTLDHSVSVRTASTAWTVVGTGDFNKDGMVDILLSNSSTGETAVWFMNGTTLDHSVSVGTTSSAWTPAGTGDFNNDGNIDILWRNNSTGDVYIWYMNGATLDHTALVRSMSLTWSIAGTGDFDNDGKIDILCRNNKTGEIAVWLMNGGTLQSSVTIRTASPQWTICP